MYILLGQASKLAVKGENLWVGCAYSQAWDSPTRNGGKILNDVFV